MDIDTTTAMGIDVATTEFTCARETLLKPLQKLMGIVGSRNEPPIIGNVLLTTSGKQLSMISSNLDIELSTALNFREDIERASFAVSVRKMTDICRSLPEGANMKCVLNKQRFTIKSHKARFVLNALDGEEFPIFQAEEKKESFKLK